MLTYIKNIPQLKKAIHANLHNSNVHCSRPLLPHLFPLSVVFVGRICTDIAFLHLHVVLVHVHSWNRLCNNWNLWKNRYLARATPYFFQWRSTVSSTCEVTQNFGGFTARPWVPLVTPHTTSEVLPEVIMLASKPCIFTILPSEFDEVTVKFVPNKSFYFRFAMTVSKGLLAF